MPSPLKPRRSPRSRLSLAGTGSGGVPLGGSSMSTKASVDDATKENNRSARISSTSGKDDTMKAAKARATSKKRAASVGGVELDTLLRESNTKANNTIASTSRRNAPAPRKSAIRQVPQVFLSPTGLVPSPESRKGLPMPPLTEQIAQLGKPEPATDKTSSRASLPNVSAADRDNISSSGTVQARDSMQPTSFSSLAGGATSVVASSATDASVARSAMTQVIRPKRRVTFSSRQEKTEFARDEPTLRLGSLRREQVSPPSTPASSSTVSAGFASYIQSQEDSSSDSDSESESETESDMDLDTSNELAARSLAASIAASLPHDDSTLDPSMDASADESDVSASDSTVNMDFTRTHGSVNKRPIADTSDDQVSMSMDAGADDSMQMDITQAISSVPALKRRWSSTAEESNATDTSADDSAMDLDLTATMEFTGIHAHGREDDSEDSDASDASDGMEMTKAITTKIEAKRNRDATTTIITDFPELSSSDSEGDDTIQADATMPMEMTRAVTGFIREKDHASSDMDLVDSSSSKAFGTSSSDDASMAMDMTMPMGQIPGSNASPSKPVHTPARSPLRLGAGAPSPFQPTPGKSPSRFRQSLRGGVASLETGAYSPAQRVGGNLPPKGHVPHASIPTDTSSFRRSIIGGIATPAYQHSPARRVQSQESVDQQTRVPLTADNLAEAGRQASGRAASLSPVSKPKVSAASAMAGQRKSLSSVGLTWPTGGALSSPSRFSSPSKGTSPRRRAGRSSLVAAVLPDLSSTATNDDSFHSAVESGIRSANGASSEPHDSSVAHSSASDMGAGLDSFNDYSNDERSQVPVQMPLNDFLRFVGVHFNDDMSASRRKPVPPTKAEQSTEDGASAETQGHVSMMRLVKAACGSVPQLEALREACREIKEQVDDGREKMAEMEQAFYDSPPDFVREIMGLQNEEERRDMEAQFKLQKQAARALVSADYYGWRLDKEFDQEMIQTLQAYHGRLQCDLHIVNTKKEQLQKEILPVLRAKHAKLKADLAIAKERQAEIETCDTEELKSLYSSIEEQHEVLDSMRAKLMDVEEQHERLLVRLEENREKMAAAQEMVDKAHATVDQIQGYTRGEAGRLLREIRNLEKLHLVRILDNGFDPTLDEMAEGAESIDTSHRDVVLILDGWLQVSMSLLASSTSNQLPNNSKVSRIHLKQKGTRASNDDTNLVRRLAVQILQNDFDVEFADGVPQDALVMLRRISQTLIRQRILLAEIEHLRCRFPVQLLDDVTKFSGSILNGTPDASTGSSAERGDHEVALQASVLLPNRRSKIVITATSDLKGVGESRSILLADSVRVERVYGSVDAEAMSLQILDCIETDPTIGSLSKAFIETIETFDS